ncbi:MAG: hypothetical protein ACYC6Y_03720 [Thermoguttaceae bacterium]
MVHKVQLVDPVAPTLPPQDYEVLQLLDENGFPVGYSMSFVTHVCNDHQCLPVEVTVNWDALGYFTALAWPPGKPLTKKEHVPFTPDDYAKLDRILKDRNSILKDWTLAFLEKPPVSADGKDLLPGVDAMTAPTPATVKDSVIEDAAYTSWALWHWANGQIVSELRAITEQGSSPAWIKHLLASEDRRHADYALEYLIEHEPADSQYVGDVLRLLETGPREQIFRALVFLGKAIPDRQQLHARLVETCPRMRPADCPVVLQVLADDPNLAPATLEALTGDLSRYPYFPVHLILRILEQRKFASAATISNVAALLDNSDFFIARRASEHLAAQRLPAQVQARVDAFRQENRDRL